MPSTATIEEQGLPLPFKYSACDFLVTLCGLVFFVFDVVLDLWAVVYFYEDEAYVCLGMLVFLLLGSSVLVQVFSWLWYLYDEDRTNTVTERCMKSLRLLKILHVFQMGVYLRYAGVVEMSIRSFCTGKEYPSGVALYLATDLSMLRLIETFSESAPQLVLMIAIIMQRGEMDALTILKAAGSASAVACSVTMYHRSLRSFLPDKAQQGWVSSALYFLWNLLLIGPRVAAIALFASVLPCFIVAHFVSSWMILFFCAWRLKTKFMDSPGGEWLFRATVGLIWYFSWFNVAEGATRQKSIVYHTFIVLDISMLCGLWWWQIVREPPYFELPLPPYVPPSTLITMYVTGLLFKVIYYKFGHPTMKVEREVEQEESTCMQYDEVDFRMMSVLPKPETKVNNRMRSLAVNFYS